MGETSILNDVLIEKWVYGGEGLSRVDGRVVLTPFVLPGESARIKPVGNVHADLIDVLAPAAERVAPPCPYFQLCGGCHYQHAPYEFQLAQKVEILREQLQRVGKIKFDGEIQVISGPPLGYRNRAQFHIVDGQIGYVAPRSHEIVPVDQCPISSPRLNQELAAMHGRLKDKRFPRFIRSLEIFTNETNVQVNVLETAQPVARRFYDWCESVLELDYPTSFGTFRVGPKSFFQVNRFLIEKLVDAAISGQAGETALDLYAGVGLFAVPLARSLRKVIAVESGSAASRDCEENARRAGAKVQIENTRVEDYLAKVTTTPDLVLADPPRAGLGKAVVSQLSRLSPKHITIVSCDPATLARDLAALTQYRIKSLTLIDLFPQTYHLETIVQLEGGF